MLLQQPQDKEDNKSQEEERERPPREYRQGGRRKEEAERPRGCGQEPKDEDEDQYHCGGYRPASGRALDAGQLVLGWVVLG